MDTNTMNSDPNAPESLYAGHNRALIRLAGENAKVVTCYADFGAGAAGDAFRTHFPDRIIDVGIAEGHLITSACGLADAGYIPFTHCHGIFALGRAYNQIRQNVAYDNRHVIVVMCNTGVIWGNIGPSHVLVEDIAALRSLPNLVILCPSDPVSAEKATEVAAAHSAPIILRLPSVTAKFAKIYDDRFRFEIGPIVELRAGTDITILSTGILICDVLEAANQLKAEGIRVQVLDVHTIKPLDEQTIIKAARATGAIVTVEDANIFGGLGGAVAEVVSSHYPVPVKRVGVEDKFGESGKPDKIKQHYQLTAQAIVLAAKGALRLKSSRHQNG